ncbi:hypothetical protein BpHYR1_047118 [Brachionus plicatilis]|uniref:Uncharacterized protein n=1 Tax=Brachionus plicatilis TaxID=10195 RepID=A0A3M7Q0K8_BRAPC|nr:hypothetical protein BpHYR1_047118 [Brachionus plicatilis]
MNCSGINIGNLLVIQETIAFIIVDKKLWFIKNCLNLINFSHHSFFFSKNLLMGDTNYIVYS